MARKSRKNIPEVVSSATVQTEMSRPFRAGLYARISMETEETLERGTIETQVELMKNFVADTEDISVAEVYKDSDYSGTNFDRPGFVQMMEDIKLIDLVIELVDARIPLSSRNPDIDELGKNKARLILMNKSDLSDAGSNREWSDFF